MCNKCTINVTYEGLHLDIPKVLTLNVPKTEPTFPPWTVAPLLWLRFVYGLAAGSSNSGPHPLGVPMSQQPPIWSPYFHSFLEKPLSTPHAKSAQLLILSIKTLQWLPIAYQIKSIFLCLPYKALWALASAPVFLVIPTPLPPIPALQPPL